MTQENETPVAAPAPAPEPAKTEEILSAGALAAAPPIAESAAAEETNVSAVTPTPEVLDAIHRIVQAAIETAKAEILAHLTPMIRAVSRGAGAPILTASGEPSDEEIFGQHGIGDGDPVRLIVDPATKSFRTGKVVGVHGEGHAFDVQLDDGAVTTVPLASLEYDERG